MSAGELLGHESTGTPDKTSRIRELNDAFRTQLRGGRLLLTRGIAGRPDTAAIIERVRTFEEFAEGNDPFAEHDFGAFQHGGETLFWKIDYYDVDLQFGSPDPSDPNVTTRVLTILLASEW